MSKRLNTNRDLWKRLYVDYMVRGRPLAEIMDDLGYAQEVSVIDVCHKFGLPARRNVWLYNPLAKQMFTDRQEQVILGSILGDGHINDRDSRNPQYSETHSIHQLEYISWKQKELYPFVDSVTIGHKGTQAYIKSKALPQLGFYRGVFYPDGKKIIPVECLAWLDDLAIAVWYMDDGTFTANTIKIATCGFNLSNVGMMQGWLAARYGVLTYIHMDRTYPTLVVQRDSNQKFFDVVAPHVISSMQYKLGR